MTNKDILELITSKTFPFPNHLLSSINFLNSFKLLCHKSSFSGITIHFYSAILLYFVPLERLIFLKSGFFQRLFISFQC